MSRVEFLQGYRWAKDTVQTLGREVLGGYAGLIKVLERGLEEKPEGYKAGVQEVIDLAKRAEK